MNCLFRELQKGTDYINYLKQALSLGPKEEDLKEIVDDLYKGKTDDSVFNYSMYEFLNMVQSNLSKASCRENQKNVLFAHCWRNPSVGYVQGLNLLVAYLLCFLDEENAFWMLTYLIEVVLPKDFYSKTAKDTYFYGFYAECYALKQLTIKQLDINDSAGKESICSFLDAILPSFLLPLLINTLNAKCLFHVWDKMIRNNEVIWFLLYA